jgi:tetratricopeptide (TPR) repeat protein
MEMNGILGSLPTVAPNAEAVRPQLEDILKSPGFARNPRLSRFLRFVIQLHLEGRDNELKESVIGIEVFGRKPDYNPKDDPIVRTEARRLRERLEKYYDSGVADVGVADRWMIELPKGGYVPALRRIADPADTTASSPSRFERWHPAAVALAVMAIVLAVAGWVGLQSRDRARRHTDSGAYDLFVRARKFEVLPSLSGLENSVDLFRQAIARDPSFAAAWAGVAVGCAGRSGFDGFSAAERAHIIGEGWAAAQKAIDLDPLSADSHDALAMMQAREAQWEPAERSFRRAIQLAPRDHLWRDHYAMFLLLPLGRIEEAIRELRIAQEIDPLSAQTHMALSWGLRSSGRYDEALSHCEKGSSNDRQRSACWTYSLLNQGRNQEAIRILEPVWRDHLMDPGAQVLGMAYAKAGRHEDAERIAAMVPRQASKAQIFAALGDKDRTFEMLDRMVEMGPTRLGRDFLINPHFAFLLGDSRLKTLRKKVGLPD